MQQQPKHETICVTKTTSTTAISNKNTTSALPLSLPNAIAQDEQTHNWPALHEAAATGNEAVLSNLLNGGILRTAKEPKQGNTALHEAAWRGYSRCVKLLCAPPTQTASDNSSSNKKFSCVLRKRKKHTQDTQRSTVANIHNLLMSMQNHAGFTALHLAAQQGHNQSCRELLLAGAEANLQNKYGDTALHTACRYGHAGATRILLSGSCDPNLINLNGDTPLHISCAMRRRKLTRILLTEGDCDISIKNSQNETPLDIAIRKSYVEIFDILNNQQRLRQQCKQRHKADNSNNNNNKKTKDKALPASDAFNWSPYGCHYFPDPRDFPAPKLDTIPKEPLAQGEQYYSDLNGCIRKGPIGVGSTCYCAPFFRHIEHKINCNRRSLRRYVHNAKATLGNEVKALAERTTQQIEQLTRDMLCDRVRCESRRRHIDFWLQMAAATQQQQQQETSATKLELEQNVDAPEETITRQYSLSRCQSLDALSEHKSIFSQLSNLRANNAQSCGLLDDLPTTSRKRFVVSPSDSLEKQLSETGSSINIKQMPAENNADEIDKAQQLQHSEEQAEKIFYKNTSFQTQQQPEIIAVQQQQKENAVEPLTAVTSVLAQKQLFEEQIKLRSNQQRPWPKNKLWQDRKLIVKAEIAHNGVEEEQYDDEENRATPTTTSFVVPKEKFDMPSYAQLKKTLPARLDNMNNCVTELTNTLEEVHLTPTPILSAMCAASLDALSDTNTEDSDENEEEDIVDDRHSAMDYLYELRKSLQTSMPTTTTTTTTLATSEVTNTRLLDTQHILMNNNNDGLFSNHNFNSNLQERLVPKNAYFHPLPNKLQYHNNNNNEQINNNNKQNFYNNNNNNNQAENILNYANTATFLNRRRAFVPNNQYLSPVHSNSGSSIASSTDYTRVLRHAVVTRQPLPAYLKPLPNPPVTEKPYDANLSNDSGSSGHTYVDRTVVSPNQHNNNHYMRNTLQPASSQLIYSANTVALALANDSTEASENDANGIYPLVSSLV